MLCLSVGLDRPCENKYLVCKSSLVCFNFTTCVEPARKGFPCYAHQPCADKLTCYFGQCQDMETLSNGCTLNNDCPSGYHCTNGYCRSPRSEGKYCTLANRCAQGLICASGKCQAPRSISQACSDTLPCKDGLVCSESGLCGLPRAVNASCSSSASSARIYTVITTTLQRNYAEPRWQCTAIVLVEQNVQTDHIVLQTAHVRKRR